MHSVYLGDHRVVTRLDVGSHRMVFNLDSRDNLFTPRLVALGEFEPEVTAYFQRSVKPDSRCVDIGSNFGYYTILLAMLAPQGHITAIEADPQTVELLRDNLYANWTECRTTIVNAAASDEVGQLTFNRRIGRSGNTSIIKHSAEYLSALGEPMTEAFDVKAVTIDSLNLGRVDFIKLDVEGAEPMALAGMKQTLANNPHLELCMEWSPGQMLAAGFETDGVIQQIKAMGLLAFHLHGPPMTDEHWRAIPYSPGILLRYA